MGCGKSPKQMAATQDMKTYSCQPASSTMPQQMIDAVCTKLPASYWSKVKECCAKDPKQRAYLSKDATGVCCAGLTVGTCKNVKEAEVSSTFQIVLSPTMMIALGVA